MFSAIAACRVVPDFGAFVLSALRGSVSGDAAFLVSGHDASCIMPCVKQNPCCHLNEKYELMGEERAAGIDLRGPKAGAVAAHSDL